MSYLFLCVCPLFLLRIQKGNWLLWYKKERKNDLFMGVRQWNNMEQKPGQQNVVCGKNETKCVYSVLEILPGDDLEFNFVLISLVPWNSRTFSVSLLSIQCLWRLKSLFVCVWLRAHYSLVLWYLTQSNHHFSWAIFLWRKK